MTTPVHRSDFIKRIFAVTVSVGFAGAVANSQWVQDHRLPAPGEMGSLLCLIAGLMLVIGSWEGYHKHVEKTDRSLPVFFTDVAIVFAYLLVLLLSPSPQVFLWTVAGIFGLYCLWDLEVLAFFKDRRSPQRFILTAMWCAAFLYLSFIWGRLPGEPALAAYSVALAAVVYRIQRLRTVRWTLAAIIAACLPHVAPAVLSYWA